MLANEVLKPTRPLGSRYTLSSGIWLLLNQPLTLLTFWLFSRNLFLNLQTKLKVKKGFGWKSRVDVGGDAATLGAPAELGGEVVDVGVERLPQKEVENLSPDRV